MLLRYKVFFLFMLVTLVLCLIACDEDTVTAVHPFYADQDVIYEPALIGTWVLNQSYDSATILKVEEAPKPKEDENAAKPKESDKPQLWYKVTITKGGLSSQFTARLFKLGDAQFLDVYPLDDKEPFQTAHELQMNAVRVHRLFRFKLEGDALHLARMKDKTLKEHLKETNWIQGLDSTVFLLSTGELQKAVASAGTYSTVYFDEESFSRASTEAFARDLVVSGSGQLCESRFERRDARGALPYCKQVVDTAPELADGHFVYAVALALNGDGETARAEIATAFNRCREMQKTGFWNGLCTNWAGDADTYDEYAKRLDAQEHDIRAMSFFVDERWQEAAQEFEKSHAITGKPETDPEMTFAWALALRGSGHKQEALDTLRNNLKDNKIVDILADYLEGKVDDQAFRSRLTEPQGEGKGPLQAGLDLDYFIACMHYANGDLKTAREHFAPLQSKDKLDNWSDFLATARLRQIADAEARHGKGHGPKNNK